jgi:methyl-accepting chemotaxis protein
MQEQSVGAQQIVAAITSVVEATHAIRSQTSSQQEQNETIRMTVENLVKVSAEINQSAAEQSQGNQAILESVYAVLQNASRNSEVVKSLNEILGGFSAQPQDEA